MSLRIGYIARNWDPSFSARLQVGDECCQLKKIAAIHQLFGSVCYFLANDSTITMLRVCMFLIFALRSKPQAQPGCGQAEPPVDGKSRWGSWFSDGQHLGGLIGRVCFPSLAEDSDSGLAVGSKWNSYHYYSFGRQPIASSPGLTTELYIAELNCCLLHGKRWQNMNWNVCIVHTLGTRVTVLRTTYTGFTIGTDVQIT